MSVRFFALIMAVALSVSASAQVAPVRCEDSDRFLNTKLASQYSHTEIVNALDIENTKLVLFGEYHWNYEAGDLLSVFSEINTHFPTKKKCLFIESMTANTPGSNAQIWTGKAENHPFLALAPSAQGFFGYDGDAFPYLELFSAAQLAGYKLINIDSDPSGRFDRSAAASAEIVSPAGMSYRNRFMAVSINEHFAKGNCEKGIYFVGKAHIANDDKMEPFVQNIDSHLKELGFGAVKKINLQTIKLKYAYQTNALFDIFLVPEICQKTFGGGSLIKPGIGFFNRWPRRLPIIETSEEAWLWNKFDATLLLR